MLTEHGAWETGVTWFVVLNIALSLVCSLSLLYLFWHRRNLFIKPSLQIVGFTNLLFQWPLAFYAGYYETWLPQPYWLAALVHGYVLMGMAWAVFTFRGSAERAWERLTVERGEGTAATSRIAILLALFGVLVLGALYFIHVPLECTGLYLLVTTPRYAVIGREISLKLLSDPVPRYALSLLAATVVPLLTALIAAEIARGSRRGVMQTAFYLLILVGAWSVAMVNGAKSTLVMLILVIVVGMFWYDRLSVSLARLPMCLAIALTPAVVITSVYSLAPGSGNKARIDTCVANLSLTRSVSWKGFDVVDPGAPGNARQLPSENTSTSKDAATGGKQNRFDPVSAARELISRAVYPIVYRAFVVPLEIGGWYVHHQQTVGPLGIAAVPRLARLAGVKEIDPQNLIGMKYGPEYYGHEVLSTISASAGYLFTYYSYFGPWALLFHLPLICLTDIALWVYGRISRILVLPTVAATSIAALKFLQSDYSTAWLTHGFGVILVAALTISAIVENVLARRERGTAQSEPSFWLAGLPVDALSARRRAT